MKFPSFNYALKSRQFNQKQGITVVIVLHDPDMAKYAKRTLYMEDGKIICEIMNN